jgi:hypothetical protein
MPIGTRLRKAGFRLAPLTTPNSDAVKSFGSAISGRFLEGSAYGGDLFRPGRQVGLSRFVVFLASEEAGACTNQQFVVEGGGYDPGSARLILQPTRFGIARSVSAAVIR